MPNCDFCYPSDECIEERGGVQCLKCKIMFCSCTVHQKVGVIHIDTLVHSDIQDGCCNGKFKVVYRDKWCRCAPLDEPKPKPVEWGRCDGCGRSELSCRCGAPYMAYN